MFVYVILFVVLALSWPAFSLLFDGLKWLYNRARGKTVEKRNSQTTVAALADDDEDCHHKFSSIDDMRIEDDFRLDSGDDTRFL